MLILYKKSMDYSVLLQTQVFRGIQISEIEDMLNMIPWQVKKYKAKTLIVQSGEEVKNLMIVVKGSVKGEMVDYAGRVIKIEDITAPGALASAFMFGDINRFPVNVISISEAEILFMKKSDFLRLMMKNDILLMNFLDMISNRSQFLSEKIKFLNFKTIKSKLAQYILEKAGDERSSIILDMTQNNLADYFGVARPSVGRALGEMEAAGFIEARGKNIRLLDKKGLVDLTRDQSGSV